METRQIKSKYFVQCYKKKDFKHIDRKVFCVLKLRWSGWWPPATVEKQALKI